MFEFRINAINHKFENVKEAVETGDLLLFAEWEIEDLLMEAQELKNFITDNKSLKELSALINQLNQYLYDIQGLIEKEL